MRTIDEWLIIFREDAVLPALYDTSEAGGSPASLFGSIAAARYFWEDVAGALFRSHLKRVYGTRLGNIEVSAIKDALALWIFEQKGGFPHA